MIKGRIKDLAKDLYADVNTIRQHLHAHPELSFQEVNTSLYIKSILKDEGISFTEGWAGTGVLAKISVNNPKRKIVLRADMDALPIQEENDVKYKSVNEGVMHACGHDVHTACLLGAAKIINRLKDDLKNDVYFLFQPGEEKLPGGASLILKEGIFNEIKPDLIVGQHVHPPLESGKVGLKGGMYMASADEIYITCKGKGGHAALPHECIDTILMASELIVSLQKIISRNANPTIPSVLTIGKINSVGGATNVIPDQVVLEGTFRTMNEDWRAEAHQLIINQCQSIANAYKGEINVEVRKGYPFLQNDETLTRQVKHHMDDFLGQQQVVDLPIRMTAEDFSYYSQEMPACFYRLGVRNELKNITSPVHTPTFDIDDEALITGMSLMAYLGMTL